MHKRCFKIIPISLADLLRDAPPLLASFLERKLQSSVHLGTYALLAQTDPDLLAILEQKKRLFAQDTYARFVTKQFGEVQFN